MKIEFILIFIFLFILQSCIILNHTKTQQTNICKVHNIKMHKTLVKTWYGTSDTFEFYNQPEYENAKTRYHLGCVTSGFKQKFAIIYHCSQCDKVRNTINK